MTMYVALAILLLVFGIIGSMVKRLFRLAIVFFVAILLILGAAIFVISTMR